jgi:hypothetical protein
MNRPWNGGQDEAEEALQDAIPDRAGFTRMRM